VLSSRQRIVLSGAVMAALFLGAVLWILVMAPTGQA